MTVRPLPGNKTPFRSVRKILLLVLVTISTGCAQQPGSQDYARSILERPLPANEASAAQECDFLNGEIARQKAIEKLLPSNDLLPDTALAIQKATQTNIGALDLRAKQAGCPSAGDAAQATTPDRRASNPKSLPNFE